MEKYVRIGFAGKTHGINGELRFSIEDDFWDDFEEADVLFLEVGGRKTPYFVEYIKSGNLVLVKFEDISTKEAASDLANGPVFMRLGDLVSGEADALNVADMFDLLPGFLIRQVSGEDVGKILEVQEFPQQIMAVVEYDGREVYIPLNDVFIKEIDQKEQLILMDLPEGLLEL